MQIITTDINIYAALFFFPCFLFLDIAFGVSHVSVLRVSQTEAMCVQKGPATYLYMLFLQKRFNFTDRVNFLRQSVGDKEHGDASPPRRHAVCLSVLSFLLLDRAPCCLAEHERAGSALASFYFPSRLYWWKCQQSLKLVEVAQHVGSIRDHIFQLNDLSLKLASFFF